MESSRFNLSGGRINAVQQETATSGVTNNDRLRESLKNKAHTFFATGRDYESSSVNHKYTDVERELLATYDSLDYMPSHSIVYKHWIRRQKPSRTEWDRWAMMGLIGFGVGMMGFLLHQIIDSIADLKWERAKSYIMDADLLKAWAWVYGYSVICILVSSMVVVFVGPSAAGSGLPQLIAFLNGTIVHNLFNIHTMVVKFVSCCFAVASGMPVGPEGPMIHLGSLVGAGLSQFKSDTMKFNLPFFQRFRNSEDRRNFISAGAAAGVASAFGAPVGGLLFSMEEVSSFWNMKLSWQIFFCAMVATFTTDLFDSAFTGFKYSGDFGLFKAEKYILFKVQDGLAVNVLAFIPAMMLGVVGGGLGALFTFFNLKVCRLRKRIVANISHRWTSRLVQIAEPVLIISIVSTLSIFLPALFTCSPFRCETTDRHLYDNCSYSTPETLHTQKSVEVYTCPVGQFVTTPNITWTNSSYNEVATLLFGTGERAVKHLFSRRSHLQFSYTSLAVVLPYYFLVACWSAGTAISSGLVIPMLLIGGLYGRLFGVAIDSMFGIHTSPGSYWRWMDPGAFALVGAASFFGGVSRLTMSLTVIMMEITNDVEYLLPIMAAIMVAKWVGDMVTHPLYHALLELNCIPFLDSEPSITHTNGPLVNLELFNVRDVMCAEPIIISVRERIVKLATLLLQTKHGGFPVVITKGDVPFPVFFGFINRLELIVLLKREELFEDQVDATDDLYELLDVEYPMLTLDKISNPEAVDEILRSYCTDPLYSNKYIDLTPYINQSAVCVCAKFSLHRAYIIFRTLGLRHMTIVDHGNRVVGMVTRKDLMGYNMEEKLLEIMSRSPRVYSDSHAVELSPTADHTPHAP